jgi:single-stranded DNA-binding protein
MRVSAGAEGESHFVNVTAFSDTAQAALLALDDGDGVAVAGSLNVGMWTTREGVTAPSISIIAAQVLSVYHLKRKRQAVQGEDGGNTAAPPKRPRSQEPELDAYGDLNDF